MVTVTIDLSYSDYDKLGDKMPQAIRKGMNYTSNHMIYQLQDHSPIDTGYLKGWFKFKNEGLMVDIRSPAQYAIFQDQGTYSYGPSKRSPKTKSVGGIKPKRFVEKSINATKPRLEEFFIKAITEVLKQ